MWAKFCLWFKRCTRQAVPYLLQRCELLSSSTGLAVLQIRLICKKSDKVWQSACEHRAAIMLTQIHYDTRFTQAGGTVFLNINLSRIAQDSHGYLHLTFLNLL